MGAHTDDPDQPLDLGDLFDELEALRETVDDPDEREHVEETMEMAADLDDLPASRRVIWGFDRKDVSEAALGALVFGIPMLVEGGTLEIGVFLATSPAFLMGTLVGTVAVVIGILYIAEFRDVRVRDPILGVIPRRLAGVITVAFVAALVAMTVWGRVEWTEPWIAFCQCAVTFVPMAIGAALGDIAAGS